MQIKTSNQIDLGSSSIMMLLETPRFSPGNTRGAQSLDGGPQRGSLASRHVLPPQPKPQLPAPFEPPHLCPLPLGALRPALQPAAFPHPTALARQGRKASLCPECPVFTFCSTWMNLLCLLFSTASLFTTTEPRPPSCLRVWHFPVPLPHTCPPPASSPCLFSPRWALLRCTGSFALGSQCQRLSLCFSHLEEADATAHPASCRRT